MSNDFSVRQRQGLCGGFNQRINEEVTHCSSTLNDLPSHTNGLVERQNRTLVNMLRVYCSRYMTDWDKYLPQVVGAYNITQHSTTGISPFMMLTGRERAMPLTFFYPEYEGKRTSPQAYVKEVIR